VSRDRVESIYGEQRAPRQLIMIAMGGGSGGQPERDDHTITTICAPNPGCVRLNGPPGSPSGVGADASQVRRQPWSCSRTTRPATGLKTAPCRSWRGCQSRCNFGSAGQEEKLTWSICPMALGGSGIDHGEVKRRCPDFGRSKLNHVNRDRTRKIARLWIRVSAGCPR
jgi:hypothetical protein